MTFEAYYQDSYSALKQLEQGLMELLKEYPGLEGDGQIQPVLYLQSRIKRPESMIQKLKRQHLPTDAATALKKTRDAVGIRVICSFVNDVYEVAEWLRDRPELRILEEKDYIAYPKPNGYRSLHLIVQMTQAAPKPAAEIQLRTIALDFWAALEHQLKYKRHIPHEKTIRDELKRCADEISSLDLSMQTLRDLIRGAESWKG